MGEGEAKEEGRQEVLVCLICGTDNDVNSNVCARCKTPFFAKEFEDFCRQPKVEERPKELEREIVLMSFSVVPGVTEEGAEKLFEMGFKNFSDLVGKTLQEKHKKTGLHRTIARRILMAELNKEHMHPVVLDYQSFVRCVACQILIPKMIDKCLVCGQDQMEVLDESEVATMKEKAEELAGLLEYLSEAEDPTDSEVDEILAIFEDNRVVVKDVPDRVLEEYGIITDEDGNATLDDESFSDLSEVTERIEIFKRQIARWEEHGFDTTEIRKLLEEDPLNFLKNAVPIIKAQVVLWGMQDLEMM